MVLRHLWTVKRPNTFGLDFAVLGYYLINTQNYTCSELPEVNIIFKVTLSFLNFNLELFCEIDFKKVLV